MDVLKFNSNKTRAGSCVILVLSMLVLLTAPASAFAQDDNTIATLRQIGRTFAGIAEKASPAVVVLTVDKPVPHGQLGEEQRRIETVYQPFLRSLSASLDHRGLIGQTNGLVRSEHRNSANKPEALVLSYRTMVIFLHAITL